MRRIRGLQAPKRFVAGWLVLAMILAMAGCSDYSSSSASDDQSEIFVAEAEADSQEEEVAAEVIETESETESPPLEEETESGETETVDTEDGGAAIATASVSVETAQQTASSFDLSTVAAYSGSPYAVVNNNVPFFTDADLTTSSYESYSNLDSLGRCGVAVASVGQDLMPTESRGEIGSVKPTGWHTVKYDIVSGKYLYNRCHLIAYELTAENANEKNLITGTRYLNIEGMLPFENMVADYVKETGNHVMYRVTPIFEGNNLVASGVLMEGESVEDGGGGILYCVYCYNVQPGIAIDYATGDSYEDGTVTSASSSSSSSSTTGSSSSSSLSSASSSASSDSSSSDTAETTYILNTNTKKFHYPSCSSVNQMSEKNKQEYTGSRDDLISQGYSPCGICNP